LLKAIDEKQIKRLGSNHYERFYVQIIAATSRNLPDMIEASEFREDLYCRLAVLTVETCPLRQRREDIPAIVARCLYVAAAAAGIGNAKQTYRIDEEALRLLCESNYPGNIRALRNLVYELTSYVQEGEAISVELVQRLLGHISFRAYGENAAPLPSRAKVDRVTKSPNAWRSAGPPLKANNDSRVHSYLTSIAREGDIILPVELCVLRRGEIQTMDCPCETLQH